MAGAITIGDLVATTVVQTISEAIPAAILAIISAVAGATTTISAASASATCSTLNSPLSSNMLYTTGLPVTLRKVTGETNFIAASVNITSTFAPAWVNLL